MQILPRFQHSCQIIKGSIRIRAAHGLNKSCDRIVVVIPGLIVADCLLLYALLCNFQCDMYLSIASRICCKHSKFYGIQSGTGIAICDIGQEIRRILRDICII